ncbi:universal stress protein [Niabella beijingensis]|uniref:universal stress protein n=1 Tax=Niabella beijingensis TaxID=2872700 RepID=UPI001CBC8D4B|nr:universal stress protein [Niabella beijingensis]MBZ4191616.1 universal stress protein [Niabella beijingensis]
MKKYIVAFDGLKYSESVRDYAIQLATQNNAHLIGVFLDDFMHHSYKIAELLKQDGEFEAKRKKYEQKDEKMRDQSVSDFEKACQHASLTYSLHRNKCVAIQELLHESIFADLLLIDSTETLTSYTEKIPSMFIRDLLSGVYCPVILVPHSFKPINKVILLYDGEPSSVHAIKMLSYTLDALKQLPTTVLTVKADDETLHFPDNKLLKEFLKRHFPKAQYTALKGAPETEIINYLKREKEGIFIALGAYSRSAVSRWFRTSMADVLMKEMKYPLFVAHT